MARERTPRAPPRERVGTRRGSCSRPAREHAADRLEPPKRDVNRARLQGGRQGLGRGRQRPPPSRASSSATTKRPAGSAAAPAPTSSTPRPTRPRSSRSSASSPATSSGEISAPCRFRRRSFVAVVERGFGPASGGAPPPQAKEDAMRFMMFMYPQISDEEWHPTPATWPRWAATTTSCSRPACCSRATACTRPRGRPRQLRRPPASDRDRRPVRRDQGADRRLLDDPGRAPRRRRSSGPSACPGRDGRSRSARSSRSRTSRRTCRRLPPSALSPMSGRGRGQRAIEAVWRIESARLIAGLARMVRDVGLAEDLAQDALVAALEQWPRSGVPDNPGAWLMATAKNRAIDLLRRGETAERKQEELAREVELRARWSAPTSPPRSTHEIGDDLLSLIFTGCHPVLSTEARVALTLRLVGWPDAPRRSPAPSSSRSRRWRSGSSAPSGRCARRGCRSRCRAASEREPRLPSVLEVDLPDLQRGLRGERRRGLDPAPTSARRRCGWAGSSPGWRRASRRCSGWWR